MHFRPGFSVSEEEFLLGPFYLFPKIRFNMDRLSHVASSDGLASSDGPKAQLVVLGHSPSKLWFYILPKRKGKILTL